LGRKHPGTGKRFLIYFAGLVAILLAGCATFDGIKGKITAREYLHRSSELLADGNYQEAIEENQKVLSMEAESVHKDQALFNIALTYAHNKNPGRDYRKSLGYFKTLIKDYPESPLREQAEIWVNVISALQKSRLKSKGDNNEQNEPDGQRASNEQVTPNLHLLRSQKLFSEGKYREVLDENSVLLEMPGKSPFRDRALFNMGLVYAHQDNPDKDYAKSLSYFTKLINEYPDSPLAVQASIWQNVLNVIEKAKQVDLEIEQKKKELGR
jgi:tetratricopeptide (TPR) repeat protein